METKTSNPVNNLSLNRSWYRIVKFIHIVLVGLVLGGSVTISILLSISAVGGTADAFLLSRGIYQVFNQLVLYSFIGVVLTGLVFSMFTKWGFIRFYWIGIKWTGSFILIAATWIWGAPNISGLMALADLGSTGGGTGQDFAAVVNNSQEFILALVLMVMVVAWISIFKPLGRTGFNKSINWKKQIIVVTGILVGGFMMSLPGYINLKSYRSIKIADSDLTESSDGIHHGEFSMGGFSYKVAVTIDDHSIIDIQILSSRKSVFTGYAEGVVPRIIRKQNANADAVTGATTTSKAIMKAVEKALSTGK